MTAENGINILRYALVYGGLTIAASLLPQIVNLPPAAGVTAALPPLVGSIVEGQSFAKATGDRARGREAVSITFRLTAVALAINLLLFGAAVAATQGRIFAGGVPVAQIALAGAVLTLIQFALNRLGLRLAPTKA
ncbi:ABZJ_00895 family protein [Maritimibacter dapengensis]|uniref:ABZJ_00895 family protein n=1 Tax=Maritimibacter dapengensis TaxID=2836868 RepID=A0ABS6T7I4_9RHOB|nr:ABZJ_00895 family protein [Maritimibacter dapengensis]MBV7380446.1 ABZJ_00895 family protein [Maritimibacter dapengensis]